MIITSCEYGIKSIELHSELGWSRFLIKRRRSLLIFPSPLYIREDQNQRKATNITEGGEWRPCSPSITTLLAHFLLLQNYFKPHLLSSPSPLETLEFILSFWEPSQPLLLLQTLMKANNPSQADEPITAESIWKRQWISTQESSGLILGFLLALAASVELASSPVFAPASSLSMAALSTRYSSILCFFFFSYDIHLKTFFFWGEQMHH